MKTPWVSELVNWFAENQRTMPWRKNKSAYYTWISEVMSQQTQIDTVIPYFNRFIKKIPNVASLATVDEDTLLKLWEGLGYYSRARNLKIAAIQIMDTYNGKIPSRYNELLTLKGIGPYCAAAIASISFQEPVPVVDGNVLRVFTRFWGIFDDIRQQKVKNILFLKLSPYIKETIPSEFNQSIMECGALICKPKNPKCYECPLSEDCFAFNTNKISQLPYKSAAKETPHYDIGVGIVWKNNKILIGKRRKNQMLGGLWEFPGGKKKNNETIEETVVREIKEETNATVKISNSICVIKHAYSHFKITLHAFHCAYINGFIKNKSSEQLKWVEPKQLEEYAFPTANKKIIEHLTQLTKKQSFI